ncbi:Exo-beta-D-glucosaminidase, partial [termite gut metagenome]
HEQGDFLYLQLLDRNQNILSDNLYWYPDAEGKYSGLNQMKPANVSVSTKALATDKIEVTVSNPKGNPVAFFNRVSLIDAQTGKRILPAFYDDNYVSVLPGKDKKIIIEYVPQANITPRIEVRGWNVKAQVKDVR